MAGARIHERAPRVSRGCRHRQIERGRSEPGRDEPVGRAPKRVLLESALGEARLRRGRGARLCAADSRVGLRPAPGQGLIAQTRGRVGPCRFEDGGLARPGLEVSGQLPRWQRPHRWRAGRRDEGPGGHEGGDEPDCRRHASSEEQRGADHGQSPGASPAKPAIELNDHPLEPRQVDRLAPRRPGPGLR